MADVLGFYPRPRKIFGHRRQPSRYGAAPLLLAIPLLTAAIYFGNEAPLTPALADAPVLHADTILVSCKMAGASPRRSAGRVPTDMAPIACRP